MQGKKKKPALKSATTIKGEHAKIYDTAKNRLVFLIFCMMAAYMVVCFRLIDLTLMRDPSQIVKVAVRKTDSTVPFDGMRADIVDRNGDLMASTLRMSSVYADTSIVEEPQKLALKIIEVLPGMDFNELANLLKSGRKFVWIKRNITPKQKYALNAIGDPALGFKEENHRVYPNNNLTAHIVGYTDVDGNGIAGIEKSFDEILKSSKETLQLSVDLKVQHAMRSELLEAMKTFKAKAAIGMVMNVNTGEVIAMVSLPDFDPNNINLAIDDEKFNRATLGVFEMGSTFKLFSTAAAIDSNKVNFGTTFDVRDPIKSGRFTISDLHSKKRLLSVPEIFIYSSNIGTAKMAEVLGAEKIQSFYHSMGFFDKVPEIELPERGSPIYPSPWRDVNTLTTSFGHGIAVSPLHLMRAASALVNGGIMPRSTLVKLADNGTDESGLVMETSRVVSEDTSKKLRQLLEMVVVGGTGNNAYVKGYNVGGKTGTAEKNINGKYEQNVLFSSFLGVFPITKPEYAVLAIIDEPQGTPETHGYATGGWTAAPVVAKVVKHMGSIYQIAPDNERAEDSVIRQLRPYLKEFKEGSKLVSVGTDR